MESNHDSFHSFEVLPAEIAELQMRSCHLQGRHQIIFHMIGFLERIERRIEKFGTLVNQESDNGGL